MNLRLAVRGLFKNPFVTIIAILSLGIGANAAIFSNRSAISPGRIAARASNRFTIFVLAIPISPSVLRGTTIR